MGRFMARDYVTLFERKDRGQTVWEEAPVSRMQLKSMVARLPRDGSKFLTTGFVLNDGTPLRSVELRVDNGPWQSMTLDSHNTKYSWKPFAYEFPAPGPGDHTIVSHATDVNGTMQPEAADQFHRASSLWIEPVCLSRDRSQFHAVSCAAAAPHVSRSESHPDAVRLGTNDWWNSSSMENAAAIARAQKAQRSVQPRRLPRTARSRSRLKMKYSTKWADLRIAKWIKSRVAEVACGSRSRRRGKIMRDVCSEEKASVDAADIMRAHRHTGSQNLSQFTRAGESSRGGIHTLQANTIIYRFREQQSLMVRSNPSWDVRATAPAARMSVRSIPARLAA